ncbi:MAG: tRNA glutamyl-Q(34) synthetase GluQRS [Gammaproteobacteria bacterium]|nr:tRNA glutamyl-Q(34) synthetase GluQRS [Gammaproteobacteria bacterium]
MHLGSLAAALASCLEARARGGHWRVRIEDLDAARVIPGMADEHLRTLEGCGFQWDGAILRQSQRRAAYEEAIAALRSRALVYECSCSRRQLEVLADEAGYPGTCRGGPTGPGPMALRLRVQDAVIEAWEDAWQGPCAQRLGPLGDVIVRRRDGVHAYQLAVVVDDAAQGVTHVVRGADLLHSTPWQRAIQRALGLPLLEYAHLPLVTEPTGQKLSKSRRSVPADAGARAIVTALQLLRQEPPPELERATPAEVWAWAGAHWSGTRLRGMAAVAVPS